MATTAVAGATRTTVPPSGADEYNGTLAADVLCVMPALDGEEAFVDSGPSDDVRVDLQDYRGQQIRIHFMVRYDCGRCSGVVPEDDAWILDNVVVAAVPPPA